MSLILVMIGLSIISIILLAVFRLLDMSREMAGSFQSVLKSIDAMQEVRFALADVKTCSFNLQGQIPGTFESPVEINRGLKYPVVTNLLKAKDYQPENVSGVPLAGSPEQNEAADIITFGGRGETTVAVKRITLSQPQVPTPNTGILHIEMERRGGGSYRSLRSRSIPVWIKQNGAGAITCCSTRGLSLCP
jgi:hypothetical protein